MTIAFYAGSFSRFFIAQWHDGLPAELKSELAEDEGEQADHSEDATPAQVHTYFEKYRDLVAAELRPRLSADLRWDESPAAGEKVLTLADDDFAALMLIAARAHVGNKRLSPIKLARPWFEDPAVEEIHGAEGDYAPTHHLVQADSWLPADFNLILPTEVQGRDFILGSLTQLAAASEEMRQILFQPSEVTRKLPDTLVAAAQRAHSVFAAMIAYAQSAGSILLIEAL